MTGSEVQLPILVRQLYVLKALTTYYYADLHALVHDLVRYTVLCAVLYAREDCSFLLWPLSAKHEKGSSRAVTRKSQAASAAI